MSKKIVYIEKKNGENSSIGRVFRQVAKNLPDKIYKTEFDELNYGVSFFEIIKNIVFYKKKEPADIYHITGNVHYIALRHQPENTVLTIHDLVFLHLRKGFRRYVLKKLFLDLPVKKLKYITTVSETVKQEIIEQTGCAPEKICVIENPLRDLFVINSENGEFKLENPVILQIGTAPNKNLINLIKAASNIECILKIIGQVSSEIKAELQKNNTNYEIIFDLSDEEILREYKNADIVAFCSKYEGFGLPVIEAQALGKPVITSDLSPMKEVSGNAAYLANPDDVSDIKKGLLKIIQDEKFRDEIIERGKTNVKRFDPNMISARYADYYAEIFGI